MITVSILTILCECESAEELETTARELGCIDVTWKYGALHAVLPGDEAGSFRISHGAKLGVAEPVWVWIPRDFAE